MRCQQAVDKHFGVGAELAFKFLVFMVNWIRIMLQVGDLKVCELDKESLHGKDKDSVGLIHLLVPHLHHTSFNSADAASAFSSDHSTIAMGFLLSMSFF